MYFPSVDDEWTIAIEETLVLFYVYETLEVINLSQEILSNPRTMKIHYDEIQNDEKYDF